MGHAHLINISEAFIRQLYAKGKVSIGEVANHCVAKGETLHASEGEYSERFMLCQGLEDVVIWLLNEHQFDRRQKSTPVIEPCDMSEEQTAIFNQWRAFDVTNWDCGDDGEGGEYGIVDSIKFRFAPGWRKRYPNIPVLDEVTH